MENKQLNVEYIILYSNNLYKFQLPIVNSDLLELLLVKVKEPWNRPKGPEKG
jgi:hypothetical protein